MGDEREFLGVNTKGELMRAQRVLRERSVSYWIEQDVEFMDDLSVCIQPEVTIGTGTFIYPNVCLEGETRIGKGCIIYPNVRIVDSVVGDGVVIKDSSVVESSIIHDGVKVGPFAFLEAGSVVPQNREVG
jgi:bifunctional UDP-N-acetylglucosamine pyrophosphorylase/glucosamine-1-phosphate N-acetyltransferase